MRKQISTFFRKARLVSFAAMAFAALFSCSDDKEDLVPVVSFDVSNNTVTIPLSDSVKVVKVTSNVEWKVTANPDWLRVDVPATTVGTVNVTLILQGSSTEERSGDVVIEAKDYPGTKATLKVKQSAATSEAYEWTLTKVGYTHNAAPVDITVESGLSFKMVALEVDEDTVVQKNLSTWAHVTKKNAGTWTLSFDELQGDSLKSGRSACIYVVPEDCSLDKTLDYKGVVITQYPKPYILLVNYRSLGPTLTPGSIVPDLIQSGTGDHMFSGPFAGYPAAPDMSKFGRDAYVGQWFVYSNYPINSAREVTVNNEGAANQEIVDFAGTSWENVRLGRGNNGVVDTVCVSVMANAVLVSSTSALPAEQLPPANPRTGWVCVDVKNADGVTVPKLVKIKQESYYQYAMPLPPAGK